MATDPWEIGNQFTKMLYDQRTRERSYDVDYAKAQYATDRARAAADTLYGRQVAMDDRNFAQSQQLAEDQRRFTHEENRLKEVDYKQAANDRSGIYSRPTQRPAATPATSPAAPNSGTATDPSGRVTPQSAYAHLISTGVPPMVAAGIVGNVDAESGWDQAVFSGIRRGDAGTAFGAGQWRGSRQENLFKFAQSRGHTRPTVEDQLDFYSAEAQSGTDLGATKAFQLASQAQTPEEAAAAIMHFYERPGDASSLERRQSVAHDVFTTGAPAPTPGGNPSVAPSPDAQRRYPEPSAQGVAAPASVQPTAPEQPFAGPATATPDTGNDGYSLPALEPWTNEDLQAAGITSADVADLPPGYDVVGLAHYSTAQFERMPESMKMRLIAVGGAGPNDTNEYMVLMPREGGRQLTPEGLPADAGSENTIGVPPTNAVPPANPVPNPPAPAPIMTQNMVAPAIAQPSVQGAIQATPVPVPQAPTGKRTRRNAQGQLEFLVDGQWRGSGG